MDRVTGSLTVFFEDPFWIGIFERVENGRLSACKVTFGAEPKDYEVSAFLMRNYFRLKFSPSVEVAVRKRAENPKKIQREARKATQISGIGTKSQQALKLQIEEHKLERKELGRERKEEEKQKRFEQKQQKRKEKHKGR